jgi:hypothetical protein
MEIHMNEIYSSLVKLKLIISILIVDCFAYFFMSIVNINDQRMLIRMVDPINLCWKFIKVYNDIM